jgi:hypothetical protein
LRRVGNSFIFDASSVALFSAHSSSNVDRKEAGAVDSLKVVKLESDGGTDSASERVTARSVRALTTSEDKVGSIESTSYLAF